MNERPIVRKILTVAHKLPAVRPLCYVCYMEAPAFSGDPHLGHCEGFPTVDSAYDRCAKLATSERWYYDIQCVTVLQGTETRWWVLQDSVRNMTVCEAEGLSAFSGDFYRLIVDDLASLDGELNKQSCLTK